MKPWLLWVLASTAAFGVGGRLGAALSPSKDLIVIGRDPDRCDVVLPEDLTMVGREHLALKRTVGRYRLRLPPGGYRLRALAAGDLVVTGGQRGLLDGETVEVARAGGQP